MKTLAYNKRARFDYETLEKMEGGLVLLGCEVKSVKAGNISLKGAFITVHNGEAYLTNATIPPWQPKNTPESYDPMRSRKVLLKKSELKQIYGNKQAKGLTIVPIRVYNKGSRVKIEIAVARGKKKYDKKQAKKERDIQRDVDREVRGKED
ncbi:MAG: SsrA-binding protein SmpB [Candidatus Andersenbacteria bacterium]|nr:SsrA-binding protein SmpB [bacterium]MDZ4225250.1 SsrA-binding protein SmpB [Candidatus Andersenbacteria bacterium]